MKNLQLEPSAEEQLSMFILQFSKLYIYTKNQIDAFSWSC